MKEVPKKIRSDSLWKSVYEVAEKTYQLTNRMNGEFSEEQWRTSGKLRSAGIDSLFYTSQAVGNEAQELSKYDWNNARKNLFSVHSIYTFAAKQKFIELDPEFVLLLDKLLVEIDQRIQQASKVADEIEKKELEPWLEKYRIWQKLQG